MTWKSHIAIATAVTLPFGMPYLPFSVAGSTAPDWSEWILKFFGVRVKHRGATHYLYVPLIIIAFGIGIDNAFVLWFGIGYLTHWIADSMTVSGVPISQFDKHKIHFFGGKMRTGDPLEYVIAFGLLAVSVVFVKPTIDYINPNEHKFNPYYINWRKLHDDKIIDNKTMREHRFDLF
jgi:inner membrane protein